MDKEQMRPIRANQATMWTLNADRKTVRLAVPPLRIVGFPKRSTCSWTSTRRALTP